jgi:8-oxo-dGTP pyrophosphatase MutT (NUDIX family)
MSTPKKNGVVAVLQNAAGEYLFIRRGLTLKRAPGVWCFVGGEVEPDEPFDAAIVREVFEEVGLHIKPLNKVFESISPNGEYLLHWFHVEMLDAAQPVNASAIEVAEYRWLSLDDALTLDPILPTLRAWLQSKLGQ